MKLLSITLILLLLSACSATTEYSLRKKNNQLPGKQPNQQTLTNNSLAGTNFGDLPPIEIITDSNQQALEDCSSDDVDLNIKIVNVPRKLFVCLEYSLDYPEGAEGYGQSGLCGLGDYVNLENNPYWEYDEATKTYYFIHAEEQYLVREVLSPGEYRLAIYGDNDQIHYGSGFVLSRPGYTSCHPEAPAFAGENEIEVNAESVVD